ncbi:MAG TPA: glycosyltransferase, partial [Candidatus Nanoarchaeia archaeon]|nr:glycosyltransferase [Candidatus Nanoarchaeia archaeon]
PVGAARYGRKVVNILSKKSDVTAYCFEGTARDEVKNIKIVSVPNAKKYTNLPLRFIMYIYALLKLTLKIKKHDVLITFGDVENYMIVLNKLLINKRAKTILEIHHVAGGLTLKEQWKNKNLPFGFITLIGHSLAKKFDAIVTVSKFWQNRIHHFYKIPLEKIYVAYTGVEDVKKSSKRELKLNFKHPIIYAGITTPTHNLELVVNSLPIIKKKFSSINLVLTGRRNEKYFNKLMNIARSLNVEKSVHHIGIVPEENLTDVYKQSDIIVYVPTEEIGWSAVLLKGILYKKPSIAIDRGALKEFISRYDGVLISNNTESFSDAVIKLLEDKKFREKIARNAYERAKKDTWDKTAAVHLKCIRDIMK